ncbi:ankyrin repeat family protein [Wolffia australiana]
MAAIEIHKYAHSPVHKAVLTRDYAGLKRIISSLPSLSEPSSIQSEAASISEEKKADAISAAINRRDVPHRLTPLHLAVKMGDSIATEMLMVAGADWSLQNEQGWSALQEAICSRELNIAKVIVRHYQPMAWAKWCRRLPRIVATMRRMRDFYMEITFNFDSSVIPFISRIAPSDTYKIWKRGSNLRADMTLAGFDGFKIHRAEQSILFLGDGSADGKVSPGSLCLISHKDKEVMNALEGAGAAASEAEVEQEVSAMVQTNILRPGIDVTRAVLLPQHTWRKQERSEMVGEWKARVYDMHHVVVSVKSRQVPGAVQDDDIEGEEFGDVLTEDERRQLEDALKMDSSDGVVGPRHSCYEEREMCSEDRKGRFSAWGRNGKHRGETQKTEAPRSSFSCQGRGESHDVACSSGSGHLKREKPKESEYKKGVRPILWLSQDFPLQAEEFIPLLDILADKVKAIRRLRELLTTKLPRGTFPVKVAIPVVPTIRVLVTFTKFEELQPSEDFSTPPTSPDRSGAKSPAAGKRQALNSWLQWIKTPYHQAFNGSAQNTLRVEDIQDPFLIPPDYSWTTPEARKKRIQKSKNKPKKARPQAH